MGLVIFPLLYREFGSKSYLRVRWFFTQSWEVTYTRSMLYSLCHDYSCLSYLPNGLETQGGRKIGTVPCLDYSLIHRNAADN